MTAEAQRSGALQALGSAFEGASSEAVRLAARPFSTQLSLRFDPHGSGALGAARDALGLDLPTEPNRAATGPDDLAALWLGPDEWLVVAADDRREAMQTALRTGLGARSFALVDVSAMRTIIGLSGPLAREVLMKSCRLDLHPRAFGPGQCLQTALARAHVILHALDDTPAYDIYVRNSFAVYLGQWLLDAIAESVAASAWDRAKR